MKSRLRRLMAFAVAGLTSVFLGQVATAALDTNISNEFWCTYAYTNAVPSVTNSAALAVFSPSDFCLAKTAAADEVFPKGFTTQGEDSVLPKFNSNPPTGMSVIVR